MARKVFFLDDLVIDYINSLHVGTHVLGKYAITKDGMDSFVIYDGDNLIFKRGITNVDADYPNQRLVDGKPATIYESVYRGEDRYDKYAVATEEDPSVFGESEDILCIGSKASVSGDFISYEDGNFLEEFIKEGQTIKSHNVRYNIPVRFDTFYNKAYIDLNDSYQVETAQPLAAQISGFIDDNNKKMGEMLKSIRASVISTLQIYKVSTEVNSYMNLLDKFLDELGQSATRQLGDKYNASIDAVPVLVEEVKKVMKASDLYYYYCSKSTECTEVANKLNDQLYNAVRAIVGYEETEPGDTEQGIAKTKKNKQN